MNSAASCACSSLSMWSVAKLGTSGTLMHTSGVGMAASPSADEIVGRVDGRVQQVRRLLVEPQRRGLAGWFGLSAGGPSASSVSSGRVVLRGVDALDDQEAEAVVGQPFQQRADADEEGRAEAQVADGLARVVAAAGDEPAEEVDAA